MRTLHNYTVKCTKAARIILCVLLFSYNAVHNACITIGTNKMYTDFFYYLLLSAFDCAAVINYFLLYVLFVCVLSTQLLSIFFPPAHQPI